MKKLIFLTVLILVNYSQQRTFDELRLMWHANMLKHQDKCLEESGADPKLATRIIPYGEYVDDHKVMCYMRCALENWHLLYLDNSIHHQNFLDILYVDDPQVLAQANLIENCFNLKIPDPCVQAYRVSECIYRSIEKAMNNVQTKVARV